MSYDISRFSQGQALTNISGSYGHSSFLSDSFSPTGQPSLHRKLVSNLTNSPSTIHFVYFSISETDSTYKGLKNLTYTLELTS